MKVKVKNRKAVEFQGMFLKKERDLILEELYKQHGKKPKDGTYEIKVDVKQKKKYCPKCGVYKTYKNNEDCNFCGTKLIKEEERSL